jgi:hypothetical protein
MFNGNWQESKICVSIDTSEVERGLRLRKKQKRAICPSCHGDHTEVVSQIDDGEGYWKKEEYLCYDCDCEWEWTYRRAFFHWRRKIRAPGWVRVD